MSSTHHKKYLMMDKTPVTYKSRNYRADKVERKNGGLGLTAPVGRAASLYPFTVFWGKQREKKTGWRLEGSSVPGAGCCSTAQCLVVVTSRVGL
jgi:hypothetical protein